MRPLRPRLLLALVLASACTDDAADDSGAQCYGDRAPFPDGELITWYGFGHDFSEYCSAGYEISEEHARWVAQAWGTEPEHFDFGLFESIDEPCWPCRSSAEACANHGYAAATWVPHRHEITHAVRPNFCFSLIEEGYAVLYGDHFSGGTTEGDIRLALAEAGRVLPGEYYDIAARFVAFLLETRGIDKLRELCELGAEDAATFEDHVLQTYGVSFEDIATEFDTYPEWNVGELRQDQACESTDILVQPAEWDFHFACGDPGIEGKLGRAFDTQRLVELPEEGMYQFVFESDQDIRLEIELRNCTRDGMASIYFLHAYRHVLPDVSKSILELTPLPAGVYVVRVRVDDPTGPVDLHMSVKPWP